MMMDMAPNLARIKKSTRLVYSCNDNTVVMTDDVQVSSNSDSSNSDYEVNVPSLSSSRPFGEKESKICVIWDDETTYEPAKYSLQMSRARSVSHV